MVDPVVRAKLADWLDAHRVRSFCGTDTACACDRKWRTNADYRLHLADALLGLPPSVRASLVGLGDEAESQQPRCPEHMPVQHRDRQPPWCTVCGWSDAKPAVAARQIHAPIKVRPPAPLSPLPNQED